MRSSSSNCHDRRRSRLLCSGFFALLVLVGVSGRCPAQTVGSPPARGPATEVRLQHGRPTFFVDGRPFTSPLFATYVPAERYYAQMAAIGCRVHNFQTNCGACAYGHSKPTWPAPGQWDFSQIDERARMILRADPQGYIMPRIYIGAPQWWLGQNPQEMQILDHGGTEYREPYPDIATPKKRAYPSLASSKWREDMGHALRLTVRHMLASDYGDRIFGFEIAGLATEEWYHWSSNIDQLADYSPGTARAFKAWLKAKYHSDQELRRSWNDGSVTLESAAIPDRRARMGDRTRTFRDPAREMPVIDYYLFYNDLVADAIDHFAAVVKDTTGHTKVVGTFYNYMYEFRSNTEFGHNAGGRLLRSDNIDFICAPPSYYARRIGVGAECYRRPFHSATLHGKLLFHDNDVASYLFPRIMRNHNTPEREIQRLMDALAVTRTPQESIWQFQRSAGFTLCEGIYESFFDLHGGYYDDPVLLDGLRQVAAALERAKDDDRSSVASVLIVADEKSPAWCSFQIETLGDRWPNRINESLMSHQLGWIKSGVPFDSIYLDDLDLIDLDRYRLVVFLNTYHLDEADRRLIDARIKMHGRTVLWCYAPGLFEGNTTSPEAMSRLVGMTITPSEDETFVAPTIALTPSGVQWLRDGGESPPADPLGQAEPICKLFQVEDPAAVTLGLLPGSDAVTLAVRRLPDWTSVYTISSVLPPSVCRALARQAGVHVYGSTNDTFYANRSYLTVNAASTGTRSIRLPSPAAVQDAFTGERLSSNTETLEFTALYGETRTFRLQTPVAASSPPAAENAAPLAHTSVRVEPVLGVPTFTVGQTPFTIPCFETYVPQPRFFRQFAEAGVKLFSFNTNAAACDYGHSKSTWLAADVWDYSGFDERMQAVLSADPGAMVIPRINLGTPIWWLESHPEELEILDNGSRLYDEPNRNPTLPRGRGFPSVASEKWRADMGEALRRFLQHVKTAGYSDHIFGYILAGLDTEEWYHWSSGSDQLAGYSTHTTRAFRRWLERKYGSLERLREAWNSDSVSFETATVPSREERYDLGRTTFRDPSRRMNVIDFYLFYNQLVPELIDHFAGITRSEVGADKVIGAFYGYMYEFRGDPEYGHNALEQFNASPFIDFMFVTASYHNRAAGTGGDYSRSPAHSVRLHDKLWYHDNDVVSFLAPQVLRKAGMSEEGDWSTSLEHHLKVLGYTPTLEQTRWMYRRSLGFAICSGAYESYFDLHGGYYDHPELMSEVRRLNRVADASKYLDRSSNSQILVLSDEASCAYATFRSDLLDQSLLPVQHQLIKVGAPADHVLLCDLERLDTSPYRFVVFLNCYHMTDRQRQLVRDKLMNSGRHLMWCYTPGLFNRHVRSVEQMQALTGLRIALHEDSRLAAPRIELKSTGSPAIERAVKSGVTRCGPELPCCGLVTVEDPQAEVLGVSPGTDACVMAGRNMGDWTSIYAITPNLPPALYRELARAAGVHIYNDGNDTLYCNRSYLTIHANGEGERTIVWPGPCDTIDAVTQNVVRLGEDRLTLTMGDGETRIFQYRLR